MDTASKVRRVKAILQISQSDTTSDSDISEYLSMARDEILNCMYFYKPARRAEVREVPLKYEVVQVQSVVEGLNHRGAEGEKIHNENGINRTWKYEDMVAYIQNHVFQVI